MWGQDELHVGIHPDQDFNQKGWRSGNRVCHYAHHWRPGDFEQALSVYILPMQLKILSACPPDSFRAAPAPTPRNHM